ncbi:antibiotic biosynthesis monooxygenase [Saccharothrix sp. AJ9571]|nr:antibiotic biosynthesis monooxygenase [Saccharothrix sp. AJ9571]
MPVTLINSFTVPPDKDEAFLQTWRNFTPAGQRVPCVKAHPGLFEVYAQVNPAHHHPEPGK